MYGVPRAEHSFTIIQNALVLLKIVAKKIGNMLGCYVAQWVWWTAYIKARHTTRAIIHHTGKFTAAKAVPFANEPQSLTSCKESGRASEFD
jgi:hypothetical protein